MSRPAHQSLIDHYESCLSAHGDTHRGVDWPNAEDAETRYRVMLEVICPVDERPVSLLDFGCGAAHLYEHILRHGRDDVEYAGVDASAKFIELARRKFPAVSFECLDVLAGDVALPEVDYVVMNGVLTERGNLPIAEMRQYMEHLLSRVFPCARRGLAFNVMSKHVDWERDDLFHVPFDELAAMLKRRLSRHVVFRADYGLYEYTTYVYREPQ